MKTKRDVKDVALPAGEFEKIFQKANVLTDVLANAKNKKSKATQMGKFLSQYVGREVPVDVKGRTGQAKLCMTQGRSNKTLYYFEVRWDEPGTGEESGSATTTTNADPSGPSTEDVAVADQRVDGRQIAGDDGGNNEEWA